MNDDEQQLRSRLHRLADQVESSASLERRTLHDSRRRRRLVASLTVGVTLFVLVGSIALSRSVVDRRPLPFPVQRDGDDVATIQTGIASPAERAATVAIASITHAGLHDPKGISYDYGAVEALNNSQWIAYFCLDAPDDGVCRESTSDSQLVVTLEGDDLVVTETLGRFDDAGGVVGYRDSAEPPAPTYVYGPLYLDNTRLTTAIYWTGASDSQLEASCHVKLVTKKGDLVYEGTEFLSTAPSVEGARDGVFSAELPRSGDRAIIECGEYQESDHEDEPNRPDGPATVIASGSFDPSAGGELGGRAWEVAVWGEEDQYCYAIRLEGEGTDADDPERCVPRAADSDSVFAGWAFTEYQGDGTSQALASGLVGHNVDEVVFRFENREDLVAIVADPPPSMGISVRFFVAFIPDLRAGEIVAMDANGEVLDSQPFAEKK